ncbi:NAD(P)/FAD-dependent oxidoreductase [Baekduia sp. Peel2402]|uniref:NAD(P)/FAD-dependent oxidoreductase n=1 Tax=Baekduia sp. Peel2402 TaxID=3458296 RepID=UPI00403E668F
MPQDYRGLSLWLEQAGDLTPRPPLSGPTDVDVAIVGAGFTGLWSAYYLKQADPLLRIAVLEKEIASFGASGRNGGWCYGHLNGSIEMYAKESSRELAIAMKRESYNTVSLIGETLAAEGVDAGFAKGGALIIARTSEQERALWEGLEHERAWGFREDVASWLDAGALAERVSVAGARGAKLEHHCARVQPALLARGLAEVVERLGVPVYEQTEVTAIEQGVVRTTRGDVRAEVVVRGTEAYTKHIRGEGRRIQPLTSQVVATEPLPTAVWDQLGFARREVVADMVNLGMYCQRTTDDRIALGGRGGFQPRHGGLVEAEILDPRVFAALREAVRELFPAAAGARFTHAWGGVWGAARDWAPTVGYEPERGVAWAGGYGDGVCASNLAARTMTDLILERDTELTTYPWVNHRAPAWPPDPLPRVGARAMSIAYGWADRSARRTGRSPRWVKAVDRLSKLDDK